MEVGGEGGQFRFLEMCEASRSLKKVNLKKMSYNSLTYLHYML